MIKEFPSFNNLYKSYEERQAKADAMYLLLNVHSPLFPEIKQEKETKLMKIIKYLTKPRLMAA